MLQVKPPHHCFFKVAASSSYGRIKIILHQIVFLRRSRGCNDDPSISYEEKQLERLSVIRVVALAQRSRFLHETLMWGTRWPTAKCARCLQMALWKVIGNWKSPSYSVRRGSPGKAKVCQLACIQDCPLWKTFIVLQATERRERLQTCLPLLIGGQIREEQKPRPLTCQRLIKFKIRQ